MVGLFSHRHLRLQLSDVPPEAAQRWEHRFNRLLADCGCGVGSAFALLTFVGVLLRGTAEVELLSTQMVVVALLAIAAALPAALVGKVAGLWIAKRRYRRAVGELVRQMRPLPSATTSRSG